MSLISKEKMREKQKVLAETCKQWVKSQGRQVQMVYVQFMYSWLYFQVLFGWLRRWRWLRHGEPLPRLKIRLHTFVFMQQENDKLTILFTLVVDRWFGFVWYGW